MIIRPTVLALSLGAFSMVPFASRGLPPQLLPVYGGAGGNAFTRSCGAGKVLTGVRFRAGSLVDAIGIMCRPILANGALGPESTSGTLVGGSGGKSGSASCPTGSVAAGASIKYGSFVDGLALTCKTWHAASRSFGGYQGVSGPVGSWGKVPSSATYRPEDCEASTQPVNGIRGRANSLVDAIGFICDEP